MKIKEKRDLSIKELKDHYEKLPYKPNFSKEKLIEMNQKRKDYENNAKASKDHKEKIDNYAKYVREMYWPKVSLKKQLEMEHIR